MPGGRDWQCCGNVAHGLLKKATGIASTATDAGDVIVTDVDAQKVYCVTLLGGDRHKVCTCTLRHNDVPNNASTSTLITAFNIVQAVCVYDDLSWVVRFVAGQSADPQTQGSPSIRQSAVRGLLGKLRSVRRFRPQPKPR